MKRKIHLHRYLGLGFQEEFVASLTGYALHYNGALGPMRVLRVQIDTGMGQHIETHSGCRMSFPQLSKLILPWRWYAQGEQAPLARKNGWRTSSSFTLGFAAATAARLVCKSFNLTGSFCGVIYESYGVSVCQHPFGEGREACRRWRSGTK